MNRGALALIGLVTVVLVARPNTAAASEPDELDREGDVLASRLENMVQWNRHLRRAEQTDLRTAAARLRELEDEVCQHDQRATRRRHSA